MPRERLVTRSITVTNVKVLGVYPDGSTRTHEIEVYGHYKDNEKLLKAVKHANEDLSFRVLHVMESQEMVKKYSMPEKQFVMYGKLEETNFVV